MAALHCSLAAPALSQDPPAIGASFVLDNPTGISHITGHPGLPRFLRRYILPSQTAAVKKAAEKEVPFDCEC